MATRNLPTLFLRAEIEPKSLNAEKRTVDLVWTTGARVMRGFFERYYEELSLEPGHVRMGRLQSGSAPLLDAHNGESLSSVIGVVESARLEGGKGTATVRFVAAGIDPNADAIFRKVQDGVVRNVSVGYAIRKMEKIEESADKVPVYRAVDWEPFEISMVPMGADAAAGVRAEGAVTNPCEFVSHEERHMEEKKLEGGAITTEAPAPVDEKKIRKEERELERKRVARIYLAQRNARFTGPEADKFVAKLIADDVPAEQAAERILDEVGKQPSPIEQGGRIEHGASDRERWLSGAEQWLIERSAAVGVMTDAAKKKGETYKCDPGEFRGYSLVELARQSLEQRGIKTRGLSKLDLVGRALEVREGGGYNTTSDFAVLLENVLHKTLLAAYAVTPDTWSRFCKVGTVTDFRPHPRYRQGSFGRLVAVNEHGEFKNQGIPDGEKQTISATTKGNIIAISRQAIVNDDMGAFVDLATRLGRAARLSIEMDVYDSLQSNSGLGPTLSDGNTVFHASHNNITTGAALSVQAIDLDRIAMASQKDPAGNEILDLRPAVIVVPIGIGGDVRVINDAQYDPDTANKLQRPNKVRGLFRDVIDSPRVTVSTTRRYLFADPGVAPTFEVAFLDGQQQPFLQMEPGWRVDGLEWKVRLDYGVAGVDFRGGITNAGV